MSFAVASEKGDLGACWEGAYGYWGAGEAPWLGSQVVSGARVWICEIW